MKRKFFILILLIFSVTGCNSDTEETAQQDRDDELNNSLELVYISAEGRQCESSGLTEEETAQLLIDNGVDVIESLCGHNTTLAFAAVCGGATSDINLHRIPAQSLPNAEALGFASVVGLASEGDDGYVLVDCIRN